MELVTAAGVIFLLFLLGYKLFFRILRIPRISNLDSRYILITGCDSGFGNAAAQKLDSLGCNVIATCFTEKGETELMKCCSTKLHALHLDVSCDKSVQKLYEEVTKNILPSGKGRQFFTNFTPFTAKKEKEQLKGKYLGKDLETSPQSLSPQISNKCRCIV